MNKIILLKHQTTNLISSSFDFEFAVESKGGIKLLKLFNAPKSNTSNIIAHSHR